MDSPEQRRRRKRILKTPGKNFLLLVKSHLFSVRSFSFYFGFLSFLLFLSYTLRLNSSAFKPVLVVSHFPLLSSRSDSSVQIFDKYLSVSSIEDRVLLPDHVLLFVNTGGGVVDKFRELTCLYRGGRTNNSLSGIVRQKVISVDNYDDFRVIVRCPLPPVNFSPAVDLGNRGGKAILRRRLEAENGLGSLGMDFNHSAYSWENLAYEATLDRNTVVVFAKGLNTRAGRESDPGIFRCHLRFRDSETGRTKLVTTRAISVAQEVVRCFLSSNIKNRTREGEEIHVAIGATHGANDRAHEHVVLPSVARVFSPRWDELGRDEKKVKYELCVCTMVWNQAAMLQEWIKYHAWLGIERWFIYDNNSDDGINEVVDELNDYNVSRHLWPWVKTQEAGFSHCALRAKDECNWVSFMDVDEYFYFPYSTSGHHSSGRWPYAGQNGLRALVSNHSSSKRIAEIRTNCYSFGPSGLSTPPAQGVTTGYTCRLQSPERHKSIIRPRALDSTLLNVVHHFRLRKGFSYVNLRLSTAVINHYKYQVWDVFKAKFYRRVATYVADWQENQNEGSRDRAPGLGTEAIEPPSWSRQFCEVWDTGMHDFVLTNLVNRTTGLLPWERSLHQ